MANADLTRRDFLRGAAGLQLGLFLLPASGALRLLRVAPDGRPVGPAAAPAELVTLGIYVAVGTDGTVTITIPRPDMGQGTRTSLAMAVAEELEVPWSAVRIVQADYDPRYGSQTSGGSTSTRTFHKPMLRAGAAARVMLVRAAAARWGVEASACRAEAGFVVHDPSGRRIAYGDVADAAARLPVPPDAEVTQKRVGDYRLVGQPTPLLDNPDLVTGRAVFGSDLRIPGMLVATIARPHAFGGSVASYDDSAALAVPGVRRVLKHGSGVAVVADHTWAALAGREALAITWNPGRNADLDDATIRQRLIERVGQLEALPADAALKLEATYDVPYLAHAPMEPMNCLAHVRSGACEVWAPTQSPDAVRASAAQGAGVPPSNVIVHVTLTGGGFGRRLAGDYAGEAAALSKAVGAPVKVVWTREDDMRHDSGYRPASHHALRGALDADGRPRAWVHRMVIAQGGGDDLDGAPGRSVAAAAAGPVTDGLTPEEGTATAGGFGEDSGTLQTSTYAFPASKADRVGVPLPIPTGAWRSVDATQVCFAEESFIDELAHLAGADPFRFRQQYLRDANLRTVLELAAEKAGWDTPPAPGVGRGIACYQGFGSYAAHVIEVSVSAEGQVRVVRVVAAINCGVVVNPSGARAQVEGAVSDGLATALKAGITIAGGGVEQSSFADYDWTRIDEMPLVEAHFVPHRGDVTGDQAYVGGLGEPGFPSVSPALANAIFALTGRRVRRLPIRASDLAGWAGVATPTASPTTTPESTTPPTPTSTIGPPAPSPTPSPTGQPLEHTIYLPSTKKG